MAYCSLCRGECKWPQEIRSSISSPVNSGPFQKIGGGPQPGPTLPDPGTMVQFETGATRSADKGKLDFEGFFDPMVLKRYAEYLNKHRVQADGKLRESDNWQKGMPISRCVKSMLRHVWDVWMIWRGNAVKDENGKDVDIQDALCAVMFNVQVILRELLLERGRVDGK